MAEEETRMLEYNRLRALYGRGGLPLLLAVLKDSNNCPYDFTSALNAIVDAYSTIYQSDDTSLAVRAAAMEWALERKIIRLSDDPSLADFIARMGAGLTKHSLSAFDLIDLNAVYQLKAEKSGAKKAFEELKEEERKLKDSLEKARALIKAEAAAVANPVREIRHRDATVKLSLEQAVEEAFNKVVIRLQNAYAPIGWDPLSWSILTETKEKLKEHARKGETNAIATVFEEGVYAAVKTHLENIFNEKKAWLKPRLERKERFLKEIAGERERLQRWAERVSKIPSELLKPTARVVVTVSTPSVAPPTTSQGEAEKTLTGSTPLSPTRASQPSMAPPSRAVQLSEGREGHLMSSPHHHYPLVSVEKKKLPVLV